MAFIGFSLQTAARLRFASFARATKKVLRRSPVLLRTGSPRPARPAMPTPAVLLGPRALVGVLSQHRQADRGGRKTAAARRCIRATAFCRSGPAFADACKDAGLIFVGPPASAIRAMGGQDGSTAPHCRAAGVPVVPGTKRRPLRDPIEARKEAKRLGLSCHAEGGRRRRR